MNQSIFMKRDQRNLLEKVVAGLTSVSLMLSYGGASILFSLFVVPQVASAAETIYYSPSASASNGSGDSWSDPERAYSDGNGSASDNDGERHRYSNFGVVIPPATTISGIEVKVDAKSSDSSGCQLGVDLSWDGGSNWSNAKTQSLTGNEVTSTLGGTVDLWGSHSWIATDFSDANFRVRVRDADPGNNCDNNATTYLDWLRVKVAYSITDTDQDGIPDTTDNCPAVANPTQVNTDGDAQGDACDTDDDNDGVLDEGDNCALVANADQKDSDGDRIGNACDEIATAPENTDVACADQLDNDDDGLVDLADTDCRGSFTLTKRVVNSDASPSSFTIKLCPTQSPVVSSIQQLFGVSVAYATVMIDPCITLTSGQTITVVPGWYRVEEAPVANFQKAFVDGACDTNGYVHIARNDNDTCLLENTYVPPVQCADGIDNDQDGQIDYPADSGCTSSEDNDEVGEPVPDSCTVVTATLDVVSDTTNTVIENANASAVATWDEHTAWTASVPGATWIWEAVQALLPTQDETKTFVKTFTLPGGPVSASVAVAADNSYRLWVNGNLVCEDASEYNFTSSGQDTCVVSPAFLQAGMNTVKIEVKNWAQGGGTAESNPAGALYKLSVVHDTCPYATVSATKIVCANESDLPNWSGADVNITASTAADFLATHERCHLAEGWKFQSANQTGFDAGNGFIGEAGAPYVTSAPTNAQGFTTWSVPLTGVTTLQVREVLQSGYVPFGYNTETPDVSAEMWCDTDVLNYDNWEWIGSPANGATYHCVAINAPTSVPPEEPVCGNEETEEGEQCDDANTENGDGCSSTCQIEVVDVCPNISESQSVVPEGMMTDEDGNCIEVPVCDGETNLLANGSFEDPTVSSWETVFGTNPALKWLMEYAGVVTDGDALHKGIEIQRSVAGAPFVGDQHAELDGYHPSLLWQKVTTIPGKEYVLSYAYSPRPNTDASENQLEVSANGVVLSTVGPTASSNVTSWTTASHSVTATSTYLNVSFKDLGPDDSGDTGGMGMYIDGVRLTCRTPVQDACPNLEGTQEVVPEGYHLEEGQCVEDEQCVVQKTTYTTNVDFDGGSLINVVHTPSDQLQLDDNVSAFSFIWVANSGEGTIVKIDTETGEVKGEYRTSPDQTYGNPSRTTVDKDGSVWVGNRQAVTGDSRSAITHVGLVENGQCEDRNGNGTIETSTGLNDVKAWTDASGARGVATAVDECIVHFTPVAGYDARHISVDGSNNVWVSGINSRIFEYVKGGKFNVPGSGTILRTEQSVGYGGYGGLIDSNNVIWSANSLLRWDTANPLTGPNGGNWTGYGHDSYGLCIDPAGNVWNTSLYGGQISKFAPNGTLLGSYPHGSYYAQGCAVDGNGDVWVAHSILTSDNNVGHLKNDGTFIGNVPVGSGPSGVAVDANGKVWVTNTYSQTVMRIDPTAGPLGTGGVPIGLVDYTSPDLGGQLYNYSDMTGSTLTGKAESGTWTVVHDGGVTPEWSSVTWNANVPSGAGLVVSVSEGDDGVTFGAPQTVTNGQSIASYTKRYVKVVVSFTRGVEDATPVLYDLSINRGCAPEVPPEEPSRPTVNPSGPGGSSVACSDGSDNDADGKADYPNDPGCSSSNDDDETDVPQPIVPSVPQGTEPAGEVLGAAIEEPAGPSCGEYITTYMKMGKKNDVEEVKKLQVFLNTVMDANIPVTGYFGTITKNWVKKFQKQYHTEIIQPWKDAGWGGKDVENGTGYVFKTTKRWINIMKCDLLRGTPVPELMPDTGNN